MKPESLKPPASHISCQRCHCATRHVPAPDMHLVCNCDPGRAARNPIWILIPIVLFTCIASFAATGGSIAGTVQDSSGAIIPNMVVRAINTATNVTARSTTNSAGFYAFPVLPSGLYELRVEQDGFKPYLQ